MERILDQEVQKNTQKPPGTFYRIKAKRASWVKLMTKALSDYMIQRQTLLVPLMHPEKQKRSLNPIRMSMGMTQTLITGMPSLVLHYDYYKKETIHLPSVWFSRTHRRSNGTDLRNLSFLWHGIWLRGCSVSCNWRCRCLPKLART